MCFEQGQTRLTNDAVPYMSSYIGDTCVVSHLQESLLSLMPQIIPTKVSYLD